MPIVSNHTAQAILSAMRLTDNTLSHGGIAYSGNSRLEWYIGLAPANSPRFAIAVLIELQAGQSIDRAEQIGRTLLIDLLNNN